MPTCRVPLSAVSQFYASLSAGVSTPSFQAPVFAVSDANGIWPLYVQHLSKASPGKNTPPAMTTPAPGTLMSDAAGRAAGRTSVPRRSAAFAQPDGASRAVDRLDRVERYDQLTLPQPAAPNDDLIRAIRVALVAQTIDTS